MKRNLLLIILLFSFTILFGQSNYKKGYIITNENDTVYGLIDFRTDRVNHQQCKFKTSSKATEQLFHPGDIWGYRFINEGKYYISHEIEIEESRKTVFLEFMVQGMMNLYSYIDSKQQYFFFEDQDGSMQMITKKPNVIDDNKVIVDNRYRGALSYMFKDYNTLIDASQKAEFNQKTMIELTKQYHDITCTTGEECIVFENKNPDNDGIKIDISAYIGAQQFTYLFKDYENNNYYKSKSFAPAIGAQFGLYNPRWSKSFSLQLDVSFSRFKKDGPIDLSKMSYISSQTISYKGYAFSGKVGFRYIYPKYKLKPFVDVGFSSIFLIGESCTLSYIYSSNSTNDLDYKLKSFAYGYYASLGLAYNLRKAQSIFVQFSYEDHLRADNDPDGLQIPQIKIGYTF